MSRTKPAAPNWTDQLHKYKSSGEYSDFTIKVEDRQFPVHRVVICLQSKYFDVICGGRFREAHEQEVRLEGDDPEIVGHMVDFFYKKDYLVSQVQRPKKLDFSRIEDPLLATAASVVAPTGLTSPSTQSMESYRREGILRPSVEPSRLLTHVAVFALAEKYMVSGLMDLASKKFAQEVARYYNSEDFADACLAVYDSTPQFVRGLRDIIVRTFRAHPELLLRGDVREALQEIPELAAEVSK